MMRVGVAMLARPTFDLTLARAAATAAWDGLEGLGHHLLGSPDLLLDDGAVDAAAAGLAGESLESSSGRGDGHGHARGT